MKMSIKINVQVRLIRKHMKLRKDSRNDIN